MSEQPHDQPDATDSPAPVPPDGAPLEGVPPVAGGTDDSPPAQGEGESDSW